MPVASSIEDLESIAAGLARLHAVMAPLPQKFAVHGISLPSVIEHARDLVGNGLLPFTEKETVVICTGFRLFQEAG
ncbi:MAG: hypothetical protein Q4D85_10975 [Corynebacterium sp.]|uniref:hypothetical protein n=1 Tax=Corynebacterium sp. TaxID=1720 RepID=UPI0026DC0798|nr:hypothetical protein [Corynebacterium sp.]MDO5099258.1 hypothetical protein [Corynebacterium sp.]